MGGSSLPFGFWSVWDSWRGGATQYTLTRLHCLSAFGLFGTGQISRGNRAFAIRLHCLSAFGLFGTRGRSLGRIYVQLVFIAFRLLVCLGRSPNGWFFVPTEKRLHCLSAFGLFGTALFAFDNDDVIRTSSLPFGFWSVWDALERRRRRRRDDVFIAFRLLVCLGQPKQPQH